MNISYLIPGDYNYDGYLDVMIASSSEDQPDLDFLTVWYGNLQSFVAPINLPTAARRGGHLLALDYNADLQIDFFGMLNTGERAFWINKNVSFTTYSLQRMMLTH